MIHGRRLSFDFCFPLSETWQFCRGACLGKLDLSSPTRILGFALCYALLFWGSVVWHRRIVIIEVDQREPKPRLIYYTRLIYYITIYVVICTYNVIYTPTRAHLLNLINRFTIVEIINSPAHLGDHCRWYLPRWRRGRLELPCRADAGDPAISAANKPRNDFRNFTSDRWDDSIKNHPGLIHVSLSASVCVCVTTCVWLYGPSIPYDSPGVKSQ